MNRIKKVVVILNPGANPQEPILGQLYTVFTQYKITWEVIVTKSGADAIKATHAALKKNPDAVVVYGGDGTVLAVASVLYVTHTPMVIIPGGTANVFAKELGVSTDNVTALKIFGRHPKLRLVDAIMCDDGTPFFLRIEVGVLAKMVTTAPKAHKHSLGILAYPLAALQQLFKSRFHTYDLEIDGVRKTVQGLTMMIANSGNLGLPGVSLQSSIKCDDGIIDILVLRSKKVKSLLAIGSSAVLGTQKPLSLKHWKAQKVTITLNQTQQIIRDDVPLKVRHLTAQISDKKLRVLV